MLESFQTLLQTKYSFLKESKLLLAVSGGLDSMVMAYLCKESGLNISLAHCNFKLRAEESEGDETFVNSFARAENIPFYTTAFQTRSFAISSKQSIQMAARQLRYEWFTSLQEQQDFDYVLTAHHADDDLETFLINLSRGAGLEGLCGILEINGSIIRPLLEFSREQIFDFATQQGFEWREDSSNKQTNYLRNNLRHSIIPLLKELTPSFIASFKKTQGYLLETQSVLEDYILEVEDRVISAINQDQISYAIDKIKALNTPKAYLYQLFNSYGFTDWQEIEALLDAQTGKQISSPTHRLIKNRSQLILSSLTATLNTSISISRSESLVEISDRSMVLKLELTSFKGTNSANELYLDVAQISYPLLLRNWKKGDYFYPAGMRGKKKLSKFFKDEKLSLLDKENTLILCSGNQIVWVLGKRADKRFIATENTRNYIKLSLEHNASS